jgi:nucleoside-diphosphate-sugar epimerase
MSVTVKEFDITGDGYMSGPQSKIRNLVLGSSGFVGRPFCEYLTSQGESVVTYDIKESEAMDARMSALPLENIDRVYFLAWEVGGAKYLYQDKVQQKQLDWNLQLMLNVMPQLDDANIPFLFVSSQLAEETDTAYGVTKRLGEVWAHIIEGVRVRLWNVYGGYEPISVRSHVVADFVWQALEHGKINMLTDGQEKRQFIHIDDVCSGFRRAVELRSNDIVDITSFEWVKVLDVANTIAELTGAEVFPGKKIGRTPITPIKGKLPGWHAEISLHDGLSKMIEKYRQYP